MYKVSHFTLLQLLTTQINGLKLFMFFTNEEWEIEK